MLGILLEAGVPTMLRYSLDDSADTIMAATILCLHGLLMVPLEEVCVCVCVCVCARACKSHQLPSLSSVSTSWTSIAAVTMATHCQP